VIGVLQRCLERPFLITDTSVNWSWKCPFKVGIVVRPIFIYGSFPPTTKITLWSGAAMSCAKDSNEVIFRLFTHFQLIWTNSITWLSLRFRSFYSLHWSSPLSLIFHAEQLWLLSREPTLRDDIWQDIKSRYFTNGPFKLEYLFPVNQDNCPKMTKMKESGVKSEFNVLSLIQFQEWERKTYKTKPNETKQIEKKRQQKKRGENCFPNYQPAFNSSFYVSCALQLVWNDERVSKYEGLYCRCLKFPFINDWIKLLSLHQV